MEITRTGAGYRLQPRTNIHRDVSELASSETAVSATNFVTRLFGRSSSDKCKDNPNSNTCEKPASVPTAVIAVIVVYVLNPGTTG